MTPVYDKDGITLYHGNCVEVLPKLNLEQWTLFADPPFTVRSRKDVVTWCEYFKFTPSEFVILTNPVHGYITLQEENRLPELALVGKVQRPLEPIIELIKKSHTDPIVDLFCGTGTTLLAARAIQRRAIGIEIDKQMIDMCIARLNAKP